MSEKVYAIAIDGPSGSGKSTLAKQISKHFDIGYLDTGAMYRTVAYFCLENQIDLENGEDVKSVLSKIDIGVKWDKNGQHTLLNGFDVSKKIRQEIVSQGASKVAVIEEVRTLLVKLQRRISENNSMVLDGRDIGTIVLPNAQVKLYIDATPEKRADRRHKELVEKGLEANYDVILKDVIERDYRDKHRDIGPLAQARDAIYLDTTELSFDEVFEKTVAIVEKIIKL